MDDVTELYCLMDDFCKDFEPLLRRRQLQAGKRVRRQVACLSLAELMPLLVLFHHIRYRQFKAFDLKLRIKWHKVFAGMAARGKSSPGWFFGFKLHIVIKHLGELLAIKLKAGKVDDRKALASMTGNWFGKLFADKGYIAKWLTQWCQERGVELIIKVRKNMKPPKHSGFERAILSSRSLVEAVFDELKNLCQIQHTRHRSPMTFAPNLLVGILAYCLFPNKLKLSVQHHLPSGLIAN